MGEIPGYSRGWKSEWHRVCRKGDAQSPRLVTIRIKFSERIALKSKEKLMSPRILSSNYAILY